MRIKGVGKLVAAFVFFLAASALAIHESKPPPPPREETAPSVVVRPVDATPPSRAIHDELPPWVKYAAPAPAPSKPIAVVINQMPPRRMIIDVESTIEIVDTVDAVDRCPDQPTGRDDEDGCPEPDVDKRAPSNIIEVE